MIEEFGHIAQPYHPYMFVLCFKWRIYMDYNATTPLEPAVIQAVSEALRDAWGNPSSNYIAGEYNSYSNLAYQHVSVSC